MTNLTFPVLAVVLCVFCIISCGRGKQYANNGEDIADSQHIDRLNALDDSLRLMAPTVYTDIRKSMDAAKDSTEWCEYAVRLGKFFFKKNNADSLMFYVNRVKAFAEKQPATPRYNNIIGLAYEFEAGWRQLMQHNLEEVISMHRKAYDKIMQSDNKSYVSDIAANLGDCYYMRDNMPKAASCYRRALFLVDSLQLPKDKNITLYMGLARIYEKLGDLTEAERFYKQSEKQLAKMQKGMQIYCLNSIGSYYYKTRNYTKALSYFKRMEKLVGEAEGEGGYNMALCRINTADVYLNLGDLNKAEQYLESAERFFRKENVEVGIYYSNSIRIGILLKKKRFGDIKRILDSEQTKGNIEYAIKKIRNTYLRDYYVATGNPTLALKNKMEEDKMEDSIARSNSYMRASEVIQRFSEDTLALHHDIAMAEKEHKAQKDRMTIILLTAAIIILVLIVAVWLMYERKRQLSGQMERFLLRLENTRNRISPHFIFNVLNNRIYTAGQKEKDELMALAQLIRKSLDISRDTFITLEEELDFVKKYVEVQSYILRPDFDFKISMPSDISGIQIPSMSIQILAENAIKHGLKGLDRPQSLHITVERDGKMTTLTVEDNGRGFDSTRGSGNGLGMNIIRQTIAAVNRRSKHPKMDMDITNIHDTEGNIGGCRITIRINGRINTQKFR